MPKSQSGARGAARSGSNAGGSAARPQPDRPTGWTKAPSQFLDGRMLIAVPGMEDPRFVRAVLMVCIHSDGEAMAITVNRPMEALTVPALLHKLNMNTENVPDAPVMFGGPVDGQTGYVLHTDDYASSGSTMVVANGLALTDTREVLDVLGDALRRPRRFMLALGYAGWGPGQLEREMREGVWLTCEPDESLLFDRDDDAKWSRALAKIGVSAERYSAQAGRA